MEEIATLLLNYGILGVIAIFYFKDNKEDRAEKKEMHNKQIEQSERMITVVQTNSSVLEETKGIHEDMSKTIEEMRNDIAYLKEEVNKKGDKDDEILNVVNKLESNLKELIENTKR